MIEQTFSDKIIEVCEECRIMTTLAKCLQSQNERIILQALKTLSITAIQQELATQFEATNSIQTLASISNTSFKKYEIEIKTALNELLVVLSENSQSFRKQLVAADFLNYFIKEAQQNPYIQEHLEGEIQSELQEDEMDEKRERAFSSLDDANPFQMNILMDKGFNEDLFDDIERLSNSNLMVESIL